MILQPKLLNGESGASGPTAQHLAARGSNSGPVHAVSLPLEVMSSVPENIQRLKFVAQPNAQVKLLTSSN